MGDPVKYDLKERLLDYSVRVVKVCQDLNRSFVSDHIGKQLLRSGTSPMANYAEALQSESAGDFIHKLGIALKELQESELWLLLLQRGAIIKPAKRLDPILQESRELLKILATSRRTAKSNATRKSRH